MDNRTINIHPDIGSTPSMIDPDSIELTPYDARSSIESSNSKLLSNFEILWAKFEIPGVRINDYVF